MFTFVKTFIDGLIVVDPHFAGDNRGFFCKTYDVETFKKNKILSDFVQDDNSFSSYGVLRGLHYQIKHPQAKLVRVVQGKVFDVAVDLRKGSKTYGKWFGIELSAENRKMLYIPRGFAHGFLTLSDTVYFSYKADDIYYADDQGGISFDDPDVNVEWPQIEGNYILSEKDKTNPKLRDIKIEFDL